VTASRWEGRQPVSLPPSRARYGRSFAGARHAFPGTSQLDGSAAVVPLAAWAAVFWCWTRVTSSCQRRCSTAKGRTAKQPAPTSAPPARSEGAGPWVSGSGPVCRELWIWPPGPAPACRSSPAPPVTFAVAATRGSNLGYRLRSLGATHSAYAWSRAQRGMCARWRLREPGQVDECRARSCSRRRRRRYWPRKRRRAVSKRT